MGRGSAARGPRALGPGRSSLPRRPPPPHRRPDGRPVPLLVRVVTQLPPPPPAGHGGVARGRVPGAPLPPPARRRAGPAGRAGPDGRGRVPGGRGVWAVRAGAAGPGPGVGLTPALRDAILAGGVGLRPPEALGFGPRGRVGPCRLAGPARFSSR